MPAALTGTPTAVTWASGATPASQSVTIPADATAVYLFWALYNSNSGIGLATATLAGAASAQTHKLGDTFTAPGTGVKAWYNPSTGSQTLAVTWDAAPANGSVCIVAYVKGGDTTAWRDVKSGQNDSTAALSVTLTTVAGDLALKFDQHFDAATPPSTSASWTSAQTHVNNNQAARLSYISASGTSTVCDSENEESSSIVAVSIPAAAGASNTLMGQACL